MPSGTRNDMTFVGEQDSKNPRDANPNFRIWTETRIDHEDGYSDCTNFRKAAKNRYRKLSWMDGQALKDDIVPICLRLLRLNPDSAPGEAMFISIMVAAGDNIIRIEGAVRVTPSAREFLLINRSCRAEY